MLLTTQEMNLIEILMITGNNLRRYESAFLP
jgi:hypothetical protein